MQAKADTKINARRLILISILLGVGLILALLVTTGAVFAGQSPSDPNSRGASANGLASAVNALSLSNVAPRTDVTSVCGQMNVVSSPNGGPGISQLNGVSAISSSDVWAAGIYLNTDTETLVEHWNGTAWSVVPSPNASGSTSKLNGISARASNDAWAVGVNVTTNVDLLTLIEHWNGTAWSIIPSPNVTGHDSGLHAVSARASNDAWAVGNSTIDANGDTQTLIEHWNGTAWSIMPSPNPGTAISSTLFGVSATASNDAWAVGNYQDSTFAFLTLIEHWNGTAWSVVPSPSSGMGDYLRGVSARASNDAWAVGYFVSGNTQTLVEHWNGTAWSIVPSPNAPGTLSELEGVSATASNDAWAAGYNFDTSPPEKSLVERWDGTAWTIVPSANPDSQLYNEPLAISALPGGIVWAAGDYTNPQQTLIEKYGGPCGGPTATPTHLPPSATPTTLYSPTPTLTPWPTPTGCSISPFTDVLPGSTFYNYVTCMACRGIINGYSSGCETGNPCFRPASPVTRGQLSKIVSNSAGFSEPHIDQTFQDIPPASTFYIFIERLASRNSINGYACGGTGEPCVAPDNRPYFRANSAVTRGQTSKIVAIAAGLPAPTPSQQTFQDVSTNSTFWQWIESLSTLGAINGYACGGAGEPCIAPGNRPYFRPGASVTRGQSSKIVTNTFFPNCQALAN